MAQRSRGTGPRATMKKRHPLTVGRGPVPRHAAVYRKLARDRPSPYGIGKAIGPSDVREGQALALRRRRFFRATVGRRSVRRYAAVYRKLARDRPSRYGVG